MVWEFFSSCRRSLTPFQTSSKDCLGCKRACWVATLLLYFPLALGMSLSTLNNALSGLQAATAKMQVTANNVANARTDGYQTQRVDIVEQIGRAHV